MSGSVNDNWCFVANVTVVTVCFENGKYDNGISYQETNKFIVYKLLTLQRTGKNQKAIHHVRWSCSRNKN